MTAPDLSTATMTDVPAQSQFAEAVRLRRLVDAIPPAEIRRRFDYDRRLLPHDLLREFEEGIGDVRAAMPRTGITPGYPSWNLLYFTLLTTLTPDITVVETGTHRGVSTILLAQAIRDGAMGGRVHTVDIDPTLSAIAREHVTRAGLEAFVTFHVGDSAVVLRQLVADGGRIGFAFLDGDHSREQVRAEFDAIHESVRACGGTVFFDNTESGGVAEALVEIGAKHGGQFVTLPNCSWGPPGNVIWQPGTTPASAAALANRRVHDQRIDYVELPALDLARTKRFYGAVFGWAFEDWGPEYASFQDGRLSGGFFSAPDVQGGGPLIVVYAVDLGAVEERIVAAGGTIVKQTFEFPGGHRFHFRDPNGHELAVWSDQ